MTSNGNNTINDDFFNPLSDFLQENFSDTEYVEFLMRYRRPTGLRTKNVDSFKGIMMEIHVKELMRKFAESYEVALKPTRHEEGKTKSGYRYVKNVYGNVTFTPNNHGSGTEIDGLYEYGTNGDFMPLILEVSFSNPSLGRSLKQELVRDIYGVDPITCKVRFKLRNETLGLHQSESPSYRTIIVPGREYMNELAGELFSNTHGG